MSSILLTGTRYTAAMAVHEIDHISGRAFRIQGKDLRELFVRSAEALFHIQHQRAAKPGTSTREVEVHGFDREALFVNWLNEILYLQEARNETYNEAEIPQISDQHLRAKPKGPPHRGERRIIKGVTFHGLRIQETNQGLEADVIVEV
jgi:SHS2 domain-containing protein